MNSLYCGCALCEVDADGTLRIEDRDAAQLGLPAAGTELLLAPHEHETCLVGYGRDHLRKIQARAERLRVADEAAGRDGRAHLRRVRRSFGVVERAARAGSGLRLPAAMRHLGRIEELALVVGAGDRFEIWNPAVAAQSDDPAFRELSAWHVARRHAARPGSRRKRPARGGN